MNFFENKMNKKITKSFALAHWWESNKLLNDPRYVYWATCRSDGGDELVSFIVERMTEVS